MTTYRVDYRTWVPDLDGGAGHAADRRPRTFTTLPLAEGFLSRVDRLHEARITRIEETVIRWVDPA